MSTKDELETQLYEKMSQENEVFLAEMKTQSPDEIISHAYEIACRDNLLMLFEDETSLSERQLAVLTEFEHPLSQLYTDWLSRDTDEMDAFRDSIACCANDILRKRVEEKYRDPAQPIYPNTRSEAVVRGEVFEWMASRDRTLTCAGAFEKGATNAYNDGKLPAFLKEWTNPYGIEHALAVRCDARSISEALNLLDTVIRPRASRLTAHSETPAFNQEITAIWEVRHLTLLAEAMLRASEARHESRGSLQRLDYPARDDERFLAHSMIGMADAADAEASSAPHASILWQSVHIDDFPPKTREY